MRRASRWERGVPRAHNEACLAGVGDNRRVTTSDHPAANRPGTDQPGASARGVLHTLRNGTRLAHEIEVRRSRFIATLARTDDEDGARALVAEVRAAHPQARHHCSAWVIAPPDANLAMHSNDDGEPAGTAGTPMLDVLRGSGLVDVAVVVTRYFGGILLGTGGLVRAYSSAVSEALALAPRARLEPLEVLETDLAPAMAGRIEADLRTDGARILDTSWGERVTLRIGVPPDEVASTSRRLAQLTSGVSQFRHAGSRTVEVDDPAASA